MSGHKIKEFFASTWAIKNKTSIYILTIIIVFWGIRSYNALPKEQFPEIVVPQFYISTIYPGTSPSNIENTVTKTLEKQLKAISGVKKMISNSVQDFSSIVVEFNTDVDIPVAKKRVEDAVDKAKQDLPKDLPADPQVIEMNFSDVIPILKVNIAGNFSTAELKQHAELIQDRIESMKEITRAELIGAPEREIQINVDMYKLQAANLTLGDVERAIGYENMTITGGTVEVEGQKKILSVKKEFKSVDELQNATVNSMSGGSYRLKDIATVLDTTKEQESFARMNGENVITLNVIKRGGANLIEASDKIMDLVATMQPKGEFAREYFKEKEFDKKKIEEYTKQRSVLPSDLSITITGDQSEKTKVTLHDLINTIIIGFILVVIILMFFMGATNAIFVALSVPLSMCIAFILMPNLGFTLNMIVLFAFLLALGIVVDDAIVVIENTHRIFANGKVSIFEAAKQAAGEVFLPVLSGTLTTLAPFIPLAFWDGVIGQFMFFLPVTLIVTLLASLLVAYIINPVFAVDFMKEHQKEYKPWNRNVKYTVITMGIFALLFYAGGNLLVGNLLTFLIIFYMLNRFFFNKVITKFQTKTWPAVQDAYVRILKKFLKRPALTLVGTVVLFFISIGALILAKPGVEFFPKADPNFVYAYINLPEGTAPTYTDSVTRLVENKITAVVGKKNPIVKSIISNVTLGTQERPDEPPIPKTNRGKIEVAFVEFAKRKGESTAKYLDTIRQVIKGIPGAEVTVDQEQAGPPTAKPINIEISGDNIDDLVKTAADLKLYLDSKNIGGVEELKSDFEASKPEVIFDLDRERASQEGISTGQLGMELRSAVFGKEISKFRDQNDEYPIQLRYLYEQRNDLEALKNLRVTYRDMNMGGMIRSVPISSFTTLLDTTSFGGIKRKNQKRVITLYSNLLNGFTGDVVVKDVQAAIDNYKSIDGVNIKLTGEQEEQAEQGAFLGGALLTSLAIIFLILVTQFNSLGKPLLILSEIFFSIIGVFLGVAIFGMNFSVIMTGIGIVALAGIVVRNGILLVEFTDELKDRGMQTYEAILEAGRTRMTPVLLTATATILGLIPLAVGLNMDFAKLLTTGNPHIFFGGDSVAFWGPLSWTMIFGLGFATFLTLILVPAMYLIMMRMKAHARVVFGHIGLPTVMIYVPFALLICKIILRMKGKRDIWRGMAY
ncbi:MAG TPA: efflux RND transporter permease subunit [Flavobacteriales bacterium]|nr:efflux RND transporter permease subunit [Flavobacteriales bacterium]